MTRVAGIDSSTQSTKVVVCDADTGEVLEQSSAAHPDGTEVAPGAWAAALDEAGHGLLDSVEAVAVGGQQHGMVALDEHGAVVRPALLWNDTRSAQAALDLVAELGGPDAWAQAVGAVPVASFTITKLRWLAQHEPDNAARVAGCVLPHDWLTGQLCADPAGYTTDRGDASGTGYWSPFEERYRPDLLELAFGRVLEVPRVAGPAEVVGRTSAGAVVAAGTGDNMAAGLGLSLAPGDVVVSLGTSGTAFAPSATPTSDPRGEVAGFADAAGRFLPLVCTLNAARVLTSTAGLLGVDHAGLDELALSAPVDADGLVLVPYLDGERTPSLPHASGSLLGITRATMTPAHLARAAVNGMLCGLADAVDALRANGVQVRRVLLIGGAAASRAVQVVAPEVFGVPVVVPEPGEYVARGAARQAAWALSGAAEPPEWATPTQVAREPEDLDGGRRVRERYAEARGRVHGDELAAAGAPSES
jgi:xylulokinase